MMELVKVDSVLEILNMLIEFEEIFPHLKEKISGYEEYANKLSEFAYVYKAVKRDKTFGIIVFYANDFSNKIAYISLIGVKKEFQRMKLGTWLLEECIKMGKKYGMERMKLEVDTDNIKAIRFYEKNLFCKTEAASLSSMYMERKI